MMFANDNDGNRTEAFPRKIGYCPLCNDMLIPKCGRINIWHWSHKNNKDCDSWSEGETEWHLDWKSLVKKEFCEVKFENHRVDIYAKPHFIELQNSPISQEEVIERKNFYGNMIWIFNGTKFVDNLDFRLSKDKKYHTFRWKYPRKSQWVIGKELYWDFGSQLFIVKKMYNNIPCGGWGIFIDKEDFIKEKMKNILK